MRVFAGFGHTAFVFGSESSVSQTDIDGKSVPMGALLTFIQKGFQLMELEANLNEEGSDVYGEYVGLSARDILTKDMEELKEAAQQLKIRQSAEAAQRPAAPGMEHLESTIASSIEVRKPIYKAYPSYGNNSLYGKEVATEKRSSLLGHVGAIISLSWSKSSQRLATASVDGSVQIWNLNHTPAESMKCAMNAGSCPAGIEWNLKGDLLAGMMTSGEIFVWNSLDGTIHSQIPCKNGLAVCLTWNPSGNLIAQGLVDGRICFYEASTGKLQQEWMVCDGAAIYDLAWRNDTDCAGSTQGGEVAMVCLGDSKVYVSKGHGCHEMDETNFPTPPNLLSSGALEAVNAVAWNHSKETLASASNDMTVALWGADIRDGVKKFLRGHKREVIALSWSPELSLKIDSLDKKMRVCKPFYLLATGSLDGSVRIWDENICVSVLDRHEGGIACLAWSADGGRIATGDCDGHITIWNLTYGPGQSCKGPRTNSNERTDKEMVELNIDVIVGIDCTLKGDGSVSSLQWLDGCDDGKQRLSVAFSESSEIVVLDLTSL